MNKFSPITVLFLAATFVATACSDDVTAGGTPTPGPAGPQGPVGPTGASATVDAGTDAAEAAAPTPPTNIVYQATNMATGNTVIAYKYDAAGVRTFLPNQPPMGFPTGGVGSGGLEVAFPDLQLYHNKQDEMLANPAHTLLYVVNQGSDDISVLKIAPDGSLSPIPGSPFPSGGRRPASLILDGDTLVVANKNMDSTGGLTGTLPNYVSWKLSATGGLMTKVSTVNADDKSANPMQITLVPATTGKRVIAVETTTNQLRFMSLDATGALALAQTPPVGLDNTSGIFTAPPFPLLPAALQVHPTAKVVYTNSTPSGHLAVFTYADAGLTFVKGLVNPNSGAPCWFAMNKAGDRLYTLNSGSDTITIFNTTDPMNPVFVSTFALSLKYGLGTPSSIKIDPTGKLMFVSNPRNFPDAGPPPAPTYPADHGANVHTMSIAADGALTEVPTSPQRLPVPLDTTADGFVVF